MEIISMLRPSHSVEVQIEEYDKVETITLRTIVETEFQEETEEIVLLAPIYEGQVYLFEKARRIRLCFLAKLDNSMKQLYGFDVKISARYRNDSGPLIRFKKIGPLEKMQRRRAFRVDLHREFSFHTPNLNGTFVTKDMSIVGLRAFSSSSLRKGEDIVVTMDFHEEIGPFEVTGTVNDQIYVEEVGMYDIRVEFLNVPPNYEQLILQYLYSVQAGIIKSKPYRNSKLEAYLRQTEEKSYVKYSWQLQLVTLLTVIITGIAAFMFYLAMPSGTYGFDAVFRVVRPQVWNVFYLRLSITTAGVGAFISIAASVQGYIDKVSKIRYGMILLAFINVLYILLTLQAL